MIKIVADNKIPFLKGVLEKVAKVVYFPGREISQEQIRDADALIVRTRTKCNEQLLDGTPVKYIATATIGYDHIDYDYCKAKGIGWSNAPGCNAGSVMQYMASAMAHITALTGKKFSGLSLGIVGVGHVGKKVESLARLLGMNVLLNDPPRERVEGGAGFVSLDTLLRESDIITMHVPLNMSGQDKSYHLAGGTFLRKMKKGAWFINTSRGEVMHTGALLEVLKERYLSGTVLDVWENEPDIDRELLVLADIATPHIAGYSLDGKANGTAQSVRALSRYFGLGMDEWHPDNIPVPDQELVTIERNHSDKEQVIRRIFFHTYDIATDSSRLKSDPESFEKFRDNYPPRREFEAYRLKFEDPSDRYINNLLKLGFKV